MQLFGGEGIKSSAGRLLGPSVFFAVFALYLLTAAPGITFWDSGELALGAFSLGVPHPPGYPVFCVLGKLFSFLPFGGAAYRMNLMSAFFGAATAWALFALIREMGAGRPGSEYAAAAAGVFFATLPHVWSISVVTEVYTINGLLLAGTAFFAYRHHTGGDGRYLLAASFVFGLAFANHQSMLLAIPGFAAYCLLSERKKPAVLALALFFFLLAYSVNLYIPIRATRAHLINVGDPVSLANFIWVIKWPEQFRAMAKLAGERLPLALAGAAGFAACVYVLRNRKYALFLILSGGVYFAGVKALASASDVARKWGLDNKFYVPALLIAVILAAHALYGVSGAGRRKGGAGVAVALAAALLVLAGVQSFKNFDRVDNSRNYFAQDFARNTLKSVKPNSALFALGDNIVFPIWYLQGVERYRDDVFFVHTELLTHRWYLEEKAKEAFYRYAMAFVVPSRVTNLEDNLPIIKLALEKRTPVYFDFSTIRTLNYPWERFRPQGLVHMAPSRPGVPQSRLWDMYVFRGAFDGTTNRAFAAEGVLGIFAWEAAGWAQTELSENRPKDAMKAAELAMGLNPNDPDIARFAGAVFEKFGPRPEN